MLNKNKPVELTFDANCTKCGICSQVCPADYLLYQDNDIKVNDDSFMGCIQCGHCMMACPNDAIKVSGEGVSERDVFPLDNNEADYNNLVSLLYKRRSTRQFKQQPVPREEIEKILNAASSGAISIPPSEVKVLVIEGFDKVQLFADELIQSMKGMVKVMNPFSLNFLRPFIGENNYKIFGEFILPLIQETIHNWEKGRDILFYNAPALIVFYGTSLSDKEDAIIASTLAQTAAISQGLGTCVIGSVPPTLDKNNKLKSKYGILKDEKIHNAFILGYPEKKYKKGIKREFKEVKFV